MKRAERWQDRSVGPCSHCSDFGFYPELEPQDSDSLIHRLSDTWRRGWVTGKAAAIAQQETMVGETRRRAGEQREGSGTDLQGHIEK